MSWLATAILGGIVGLDATSFPQIMISRPVVAGVLTGGLFGRPAEGLALGFLVEVFALIILPIGAARYPESGTATVAATAAYLAATPPGLQAGSLLLALAFALGWERLAGESVVLHRRSNGRMLIGGGPLAADALERRHLVAMTLDFMRGGLVAVAGALAGYGLLRLLAPLWELPQATTLAVLGIAAAGMLGTAVPLFGAGRAARVSLVAGLLVGVALAVAVW
ncbi:MAG TPA: PTS sugar transporter subunit IIC [Longimicrobiales bacterium]|nr:PTS sugar transporter subunit IIC [Longimicrobiales bacterium]